MTKIPGDLVLGLARNPAGGFLLASIDFPSGGRGSAALSRVPETGGRATTTPIVRRPTGAARVANVISAVSPAGAVAAASRRSGGPASRSRLIVTTVRPDGHRISEQRVPKIARGVGPFVVEIGPTGAVGLITLTPTKRGLDGATAAFSFRPAGAARFAAPVQLPGASVPSADGTENSDTPGSQLQLVMAPDGGAAIVDGPASSLRRVTPAGAVSAEQRIDPKGAWDTTAAFRDDGTLVAASTRGIESKTKTIDDQYYSSQIMVAEWPPAAPVPTVRELPVRPGEVEANRNFSLALGPGGRTILTLADGNSHLAVLSGTGTAVEPLGRVAAPVAYDARAFPTADGGTTLLWARDVDGGDGKPTADTALLTAKAAPGTPFAAPRTIRTSRQGSLQVLDAVALPDDRLAIAFDWSAGEESLLVTSP